MGSVREKMSELIGLLVGNLRSYNALLEVAEEMYAELHGGKVDGVGRIVSTRAELQEEISRRDGLIDNISKDLPGVLPDRRIIVFVQREVFLVAAIQEVDQRSGKVMGEKQAQLLKGLIDLRRGKKLCRNTSRGQKRIRNSSTDAAE